MAIGRRGGRSSNLGVVLLAGSILNFGVNNIPPATLALIAGQSAIFLDMFRRYFPSAESVCISSYLGASTKPLANIPFFVYHRDWPRMILGAFYHGSDMHLYYNMLSLLYKGTWLEKRLGTPYFVYLICVFTALTSAVYVALGLVLSQALNSDSYQMQCAVGFSGVLFALKVLAAHYTPSGPQYVFGFIPVPSKHVYWAELVIIQMLVPNASFIGHLAGILVGVAYTWGPLRIIMDAFLRPATAQRPNGARRPTTTPSFSYRGQANPSAPPYDGPAPGYYGRDAHYGSHYPTPGVSPNLDDLRSRRSQYYQ